MDDLAAEKLGEFEALDKLLSEQIDTEILSNLEKCLSDVRKKSHALSSSLKRCFDNARKSRRFVLVYDLGKEDAKKEGGERGKWGKGDEELKKYLEDYLKEYFKKNDFMHYREFVRLLRACSIEVGGETSSQIKEMYNSFFLGKRLVTAYKLGRVQNS